MNKDLQIEILKGRVQKFLDFVENEQEDYLLVKEQLDILSNLQDKYDNLLDKFYNLTSHYNEIVKENSRLEKSFLAKQERLFKLFEVINQSELDEEVHDD